MPACPEAPTRRGTQSKLTRRLGDRMRSCRHQGRWRTAVSERHWETRAAFPGRSGSGQPRGLAPSSPCPLPPRASRPSPLPQLPRSLATCRDGARPSLPAGLRPRPPPPRSPPGQNPQKRQDSVAAGGGVALSFVHCFLAPLGRRVLRSHPSVQHQRAGPGLGNEWAGASRRQRGNGTRVGEGYGACAARREGGTRSVPAWCTWRDSVLAPCASRRHFCSRARLLRSQWSVRRSPPRGRGGATSGFQSIQLSVHPSGSMEPLQGS